MQYAHTRTRAHASGQRATGLGVPDNGGLIHAAREEERACAVPLKREHRALVPAQSHHQLPLLVPDPAGRARNM
eukprot:1983233-Rhodomonas_salina.1